MKKNTAHHVILKKIVAGKKLGSKKEGETETYIADKYTSFYRKALKCYEKRWLECTAFEQKF